jgi:signal transduction histidine kinase
MTVEKSHDYSSLSNDPAFIKQVAIEKLGYMRDFAKSSTVATILAPLLCIPLYDATAGDWKIYAWFLLMAVVVTVRIFLVKSIDLDKDTTLNFKKLNWGVGLVTLAWGMGWLLLVPDMTAVNYLLYQIISLSVLFVGMVGYCVNWKTFCAFVLPLKLPEVLFTFIFYNQIIWPIAAGSLVTFYLALKMALLFSRSWERSMALRFQNEALVNDLILEKNASDAANLAKSDFIATASHDLRQPMQAINIFMEMLQKESFSDSGGLIVKKLRFSIDLLNKMFNTLLDISKLDAKAVIVVEETFHAQELLDELNEYFHPIAQEKNIEFRFSQSQFLIHGDRALTAQLIRNLLANAIQYTQKGHVEVELRQEIEWLVIVVSDTGLGIPKEDLPLIYKEFYRSQYSRNLHDGLGLGLSIVNRILKIMRASMSVRSELGIGTVFTITTPFKVSQLVMPTTEQLTEGFTPESAKVLNSFQSRHIGIIENDRGLLDAYAYFFSNAGFSVHVLPIVETDLQKYLLNIPHLDFILSDYRLDSGNSLHLIQRLRDEFNAEIPAVILTADTSPENLKIFNDLNIQVIYKPIEAKEVLAFISEHLK